MQYVAVVVGCELAVEDGSSVRLLRVEEGDCEISVIFCEISDRIVNKWNTLSENIVAASSLNNFKGKLQRLHNYGSSTGFLKSG